MNFSVTQFGKKLPESKYTWDETTKTFFSNEDNLVLDFTDINGILFKTGDNCTFKTGSYCTFKTGSNCTFTTSNNCTFSTGDNCAFITGSYCIFDTDNDCTFTTSNHCTFDTSYNCTFKTGKNCIIIRRDIFEVIQPKKGKTIKLHKYNVKGFDYVKPTKTIVIDGKKIEISEESFKSLIQQLLEN